MKKLKWLVASGLALCATAALFAVGCVSTALESPSDVSIDDTNKLTWAAVTDARSYVVEITNVETGERIEAAARKTNYSLSTLLEGDYEIRIKAIADERINSDSDWSIVYSFHKDYETGCIYTLINNNTEYAITKYGKASGKIFIEDTYRGKPVTEIYERAFRSCAKATEIVLGNKVRSIGDSAFSNCTQLTSITLPESLTYIGGTAFQSCYNLTEIVIPEGVTAINEYTFNYCRGLTSVVLPDTLTTIGESAFSACSSLTSFTVPDAVTAIGKSAFSGCSELTQCYVGENVAEIGASAFYGCAELEECTFADNCQLTYIGNSAFSGCLALKGMQFPDKLEEIADAAFSSAGAYAWTEITLPDSVKHIGISAFRGTAFFTAQSSEPYVYADRWLIDTSRVATERTITEATLKEGTVGIADYTFSMRRVPSGTACTLTSVTLPASVKYIGRYAFSGQTVLGRFISPENGVKEIFPYAFYGCSTLRNVQLNDGLVDIHNFAFCDCTMLDNNTVAGSLVPSTVTHVGRDAFYRTALWNNVESDGVAYAGNWVVGVNDDYSPTAITLKAETIGIADYAFAGGDGSGQENLMQINGTSNVRYIGKGAFMNCAKLAAITLSRNLRVIEDATFYGCKELYSVEFPSRLTKIGAQAFAGCERLNEVDLSESMVSELGFGAFMMCINIKEIKFGEDLTAIPTYAFYKNEMLETLVIPDTVTYIGPASFGNCISLREVTLSQNVETIDMYAFFGAAALPAINIPDSVKTIGTAAFAKCPFMGFVTFGENVESIGAFAFADCAWIKEIEFPASLRSIGEYAFRNVDFTYVVLPSTIQTIGANAFFNHGRTMFYTEFETLPEAWAMRWNSGNNAVLWGCEYDDNGDLYAFTYTENSVSNFTSPYATWRMPKKGELYGIGWATTPNATEAEYLPYELEKVPFGTKLYVVWGDRPVIKPVDPDDIFYPFEPDDPQLPVIDPSDPNGGLIHQ